MQFGIDLGIVAIYKFNKDFIAENLCIEKEVEDNNCQGHCFIEKAQQPDTEDAPVPIEELRCSEGPYFTTESEIVNVSRQGKLVKYSDLILETTNGHNRIPFQPPRFA
mgnify:CR=1 FL=1